MASFLAVLLLSCVTLFLGTYVADRLEARTCSPVEQDGRQTH